MKLRINGHNYETDFTGRLKYYLMRMQGRYDYPKPLVIVHGDNCCSYWISDPKELEDTARLPLAQDERE